MANVKELLKSKLTTKELETLKRSYDTVGDIAILEIPKELIRKQKIIAEAIMQNNKHIKVCVKKSGKHEGRYRTRQVKWIAGERRTLTEHRESGVSMLVDVATCYFSPRLSSERLRVANMCKRKEKVLVIGAGVGPYPLVIARASGAKVTGIEINPVAYELAKKNVERNKLKDLVEIRKGDAKKILGKEKYDRVIVMLPKTGEPLWKTAIKAAKSRAILHLYTFVPQEVMDKKNEKVHKLCRQNGRNCKVVREVRAGQPSPKEFRVCLDVRMA